MNAVVRTVPEEAPDKWEMKDLKPWHKQFCSMLAQGIDRETIASVLDITPTYVSMLTKQPLIQNYIREMCQFANLQLEAQFAKGVEVIGNIMENGDNKERLQAVRLNAELTHRIGSGSGAPVESSNTNDRLIRLAERLLALQERTQTPIVPINGEFHEVKKDGVAEIRANQSAQEDGNGSVNPGRLGEEG